MDNTLEKKIINYGEAIFEATYQEMKADDNVFVYGLGVDDPKGIMEHVKIYINHLEIIVVLILP